MRLSIVCVALALSAAHSLLAQSDSSPAAASPEPNLQTTYADAKPYIDEPLSQLEKRIPQLKGVRPAESQEELSTVLFKTGERVDDFFRHITDLTAREDISLNRLRQELPTSHPELTGERVHDSYLILRHANRVRSDIIEFRTDPKGDNFDQTVVKKGFIVTSGFALDCNYFATAFQPEATFRLVGEQKIDGQETYVVGFAQLPSKATLTVRMRGRTGTPVNMLVQGIAWIDRTSYQILRMRTDMLAPRWDVGLNQQTTEVTLSKVQLADVAAPLWLPSSVKVFVEFTTHNGAVDEFYELSYRNEHRYSDYQRYRVATKVVPQ